MGFIDLLIEAEGYPERITFHTKLSNVLNLAQPHEAKVGFMDFTGEALGCSEVKINRKRVLRVEAFDARASKAVGL